MTTKITLTFLAEARLCDRVHLGEDPFGVPLRRHGGGVQASQPEPRVGKLLLREQFFGTRVVGPFALQATQALVWIRLPAAVERKREVELARHSVVRFPHEGACALRAGVPRRDERALNERVAAQGLARDEVLVRAQRAQRSRRPVVNTPAG